MTFKDHVFITLLGGGTLLGVGVIIVLAIVLRLILWLLFVPYWLTFLPSWILVFWLVGYLVRRVGKDLHR